MNTDELIEFIRASVIGADEMIDGPFGPRPVIYADYTASGRALTFVEDYVREVVLPLYANTHTESSGTGRQTSRLREEARAVVAASVGARPDEHAVLFCGSGATYAIDKLIGVLGLRVPSALDDQYHLSEQIPIEARPVVFIGPYEHHSNEIPWRESIADVVTIREDADGHVSLDHLRDELERHRDRPLKIGSFSAASNVTGILTDVRAIATLLHAHGALSFWDYAAAAPYIEIDMGSTAAGKTEKTENAEHTRSLDYLDAVFISPHKLIGGPGTPGLLVARRELFTNRVPDVPGGGTVMYVNPVEHDYLTSIEQREEGGTPAIIGSIRAGLVFQLKDAVGANEIRRREEAFVRRAIATWEQNPNLEILGSRTADRLSIVSFVVRHGQRWLHHNAVVAILNDVFGIQSRGGCSCAGPYGHRLLGIDIERSHRFEREIARGCEGIKPGWVRVNFNYFIDDDTFDYIVAAVDLVATDGWRLLPWYRFEPTMGLWHHANGDAEPPASLYDIDYSGSAMTFPSVRRRAPTGSLSRHLEAGRKLMHAEAPRAPDPPVTTDDFEHLRWFPYPGES